MLQALVIGFWILMVAPWHVASLSASSASAASPDIRLVGLPGGAPQILPSQYVKTFCRWSMIGDTHDADARAGGLTLQALTGAPGWENNVDHVDADDDDSMGFVDPTSTTDLWWPKDLSCLQVRPTLDVLFQSGGRPRYVAGGVDVRVPPHAAKNGQAWQNFGMHSQPIARQWTTFEYLTVEPNFRVELLIGEIQQPKETKENTDDESQSILWKRFHPPTSNDDDASSYGIQEAQAQTKKALETLGMYLSTIDDEVSSTSSPLLSGFHIVSIPTTTEWMDLPLPISDTFKGENEDKNKLQAPQPAYAFASIATAEPDTMELLAAGMDSGMVAMTATAILAVNITPVAAGSKSKYLPECYKPLYL